ncbi:MAG: hypothetical protein HC846_07805 [Blastocatellia bacterium]|nr:hypothetical protein [Blastocatellia bacterium]
MLSPKALDVLSALLEKEGKILGKQEILNIVWADTFVEEGVLTQNIYKLRSVLGTDENGKQLIENIPRRGYRLTVPIRILRTDEVLVGANGQPNNLFSDETTANAFPTNDNLTDSSFATTQIPLVSKSTSRPHSKFRPTILLF